MEKMEMKNDCQLDYIKEAFDKLYSSVMPYIDWTQFADADTTFKELDRKVHSEIYILKKCLAERDRAVEAGLARSKEDRERISDLEKELNYEHKHGEDLKAKVTLLENSRTAWRSRAQHAEKKVEDLNKKIHELEEENANLRVTPDDAIRVKSLERANEILRRENGTLWTTLEKRDIGERTCYESLSETIDFQNKKIEELEAEKARLKEAVDIQKTTFKKLEENVDLSYGHEFEFGDEVFVPWSCDPYMYIKSGMMYNPRTERLVYVGKDQHLKWFGNKFLIV